MVFVFVMVRLIIYPCYFVFSGLMITSIGFRIQTRNRIRASGPFTYYITLKFGSMYVLCPFFPTIISAFGEMAMATAVQKSQCASPGYGIASPSTHILGQRQISSSWMQRLHTLRLSFCSRLKTSNNRNN